MTKFNFTDVDNGIEELKNIKLNYQKEFGDLGVYGKYYQNDQKSENFSKLILINNEIVGYFSIWNNEIHPKTQYFSIILKKDFQTQENYEIVFNELLQYTNNKNKQTAFLDSEVVKIRFLESIDSFVVNICKTGIEKKINLKISEKHLKLDKYKIISINKAKVSKIDFFKLLKKGYYNAHIYNPAVILENEENINFYNNDIYQEGSFLIYERNKIVGFFISWYVDDNEILLGDFYLDNNINIKVLNVCLKNFIEIIKKNNYIEFISYEIDSANKYATFVFNYLNIYRNVEKLNLVQLNF